MQEDPVGRSSSFRNFHVEIMLCIIDQEGPTGPSSRTQEEAEGRRKYKTLRSIHFVHYAALHSLL